MALSSTDLLDILSADPTDPMTRGRLMAVRRERLTSSDLEEQALLDELLAAPTRPLAPVVHVPWSSVLPRHESRRQPLNEWDLAWVTGLSDDPASIGEADCIELHRMLVEAEPGSSQARLIAQKFGPVEAFHEARVEASNRAAAAKVAQFPIPPIPERACRLLTDAIAVDHPDLHANEAANRARKVLVEVDAARRGGQPAPEPPTAVQRAQERHQPAPSAAGDWLSAPVRAAEMF